jgi:hypothetical protein
MKIEVSKTAVADANFSSRKFNKFHVSPKADRTIDGIVFASKLEMKVYLWLKEAGLEFTRQPRYVLQPKFELNGKKYREICYVGDFLVNGVVVDAKGVETDGFKIKEKLLAGVHRLQIVKLRNKRDTLAFIGQVKNIKT